MIIDALTAARWSPYAACIGIGVLSWLTLLFSRRALGCSTSFARSSGMIERALRGEHAPLRTYYEEIEPKIDWQWMLVVGIVLGALAASLLSGQFPRTWVPARWAAAYGVGAGPRTLIALVGGVLLGFGARWADGCTSGHGSSGAMQLGISSWLSAVSLFVSRPRVG